MRAIPTRITLPRVDASYRPNRPTQPTLVSLHHPTPWHLPTILNVNVHALKEKVDDLQCACDQNGVDLAIVSETWITDDMPESVFQLQNYDLVSNNRPT